MQKRRLFLTAAAILTLAWPASGEQYTPPIEINGWEGGGVEGTETGQAEYCQIAHVGKQGQEFLAIWLDQGLILAISGSELRMNTGLKYSMTMSAGAWTGTANGKANDPQTFFALLQIEDDLVAGLRAAERITASGKPGDFILPLPNAKAAFEALEDCYRTEVAGLVAKYDVEITSEPSTSAQQAVLNALEIISGKVEGTPEKAFALAESAAVLGDRDALWLTGQMALAEYGTDMPRAQALARILSAAEAGHPDALTYLAAEYLATDDTETNKVGRAYLERAAAQGHAPAIVALRLLEHGDAR